MAAMPALTTRTATDEKAAQSVATNEATLALVRQAIAGSRDAFDELVFLYRDQVYSAAWQLTRNADDALDITQEVFIRTFRALPSFKGNARFSTWLHRIVLNTGVDFIRRERKHWQNVSESDAEVADGGERRQSRPEGAVPASQRNEVYLKELQGRVNLALAQLSARQREVFVLRYYQELNLKEIAETLRCTEGSVKRHLFRAQSRLRELLEDLGAR